jgi:hypothetical protein
MGGSVMRGTLAFGSFFYFFVTIALALVAVTGIEFKWLAVLHILALLAWVVVTCFGALGATAMAKVIVAGSSARCGSETGIGAVGSPWRQAGGLCIHSGGDRDALKREVAARYARCAERCRAAPFKLQNAGDVRRSAECRFWTTGASYCGRALCAHAFFEAAAACGKQRFLAT